MENEERRLETEHGVLVYNLCRKKVKNVNLRIKGDGSVWVSAAARVPLREIERILRERSGWIFGILQRRQEQKPSPMRGSGETMLPLWGKLFRVRYLPWQPGIREQCRIVGEEIALCQENPEDWARSRELWKELLREEAERVMIPLFTQWSDRFSEKYGVKKQRLVIKPMTSRWGSRSERTNRIALNLYLAAKPKEYLEYTIVHELCHLLRMDHSSQFHQLVEENLPGAYALCKKMRHDSPLG